MWQSRVQSHQISQGVVCVVGHDVQIRSVKGRNKKDSLFLGKDCMLSHRKYRGGNASGLWESSLPKKIIFQES